MSSSAAVAAVFGSVGWAQFFFGLVLLCIFTSMLKQSEQANDGSASKPVAVPPGFASFQRKYLAVMSIVMLADWLQGPYIYDLYTVTHGLTESQYSSLFLSGFLSSAVFGTPVGVLVDTIGRRRGCLLYCALEIVINALEHLPSFEMLLLGRFLGGISTSLLGCAFESWMVSTHKAHGYPAALLDQTFTIVSIANGILAVVGGLFANALEKPLGLGPIGPFQAAIALTALAMALVHGWEENYGEAAPAEASQTPATHPRTRKKGSGKSSGSGNGSGNGSLVGAPAGEAPAPGLSTLVQDGLRSMGASMSSAAAAMAADPRLWMLGLVQAFFEGSMFGWVSQWVPALFALRPANSPALPVGVIFACLMLCISTGANLFAALQSRGASVTTLMTLTLALSLCSMILPFLVPYPPSFTLVLIAFCGFEAACGAFMPAMGVLRAEIIPSSLQSTIMTAYRLPLNAVVVFVTHLGKTGAGSWKGWEAACLVSAIFFALALLLHIVGSRQPTPANAGVAAAAAKARDAAATPRSRGGGDAASSRRASSSGRRSSKSPGRPQATPQATGGAAVPSATRRPRSRATTPTATPTRSGRRTKAD